MIQIKSEAAVSAQHGLLASAWDSNESFIFTPSPCPVTDEWLRTLIRRLPSELYQDHFGILTSGSTGTPKLIMGSKHRTGELSRLINEHQKLEPVQNAILALPLPYSYSLVNQWLWAHIHGKTLHSTRGMADPQSLFRALQCHSASMLCLVGSQVPLLRRYLEPGMQFPEVLRLNFAGGPFPQADLSWLHEIFPSAIIFHNYGCTEALPRLTIRSASDFDDPMTLGAPLPGVELDIDATGGLRFRSAFGCNLIADDDHIQLVQRDEWIATGDQAERLESGQFRLLGRNSEVFKRHGEKVSLALLAYSLWQAWNGELAFYLETAPDGENGHVLILSPVPGQPAVRKLLLHLREHFRRPLWPIRIEGVKAIPLSVNGKPDITTLCQLPRTQLWKQIL
jgi:acyl-coenzyme A synthetase/AMP-(fatty) acid ligase